MNLRSGNPTTFVGPKDQLLQKMLDSCQTQIWIIKIKSKWERFPQKEEVLRSKKGRSEGKK